MANTDDNSEATGSVNSQFQKNKDDFFKEKKEDLQKFFYARTGWKTPMNALIRAMNSETADRVTGGIKHSNGEKQTLKSYVEYLMAMRFVTGQNANSLISAEEVEAQNLKLVDGAIPVYDKEGKAFYDLSMLVIGETKKGRLNYEQSALIGDTDIQKKIKDIKLDQVTDICNALAEVTGVELRLSDKADIFMPSRRSSLKHSAKMLGRGGKFNSLCGRLYIKTEGLEPNEILTRYISQCATMSISTNSNNFETQMYKDRDFLVLDPSKKKEILDKNRDAFQSNAMNLQFQIHILCADLISSEMVKMLPLPADERNAMSQAYLLSAAQRINGLGEYTEDEYLMKFVANTVTDAVKRFNSNYKFTAADVRKANESMGYKKRMDTHLMPIATFGEYELPKVYELNYTFEKFEGTGTGASSTSIRVVDDNTNSVGNNDLDLQDTVPDALHSFWEKSDEFINRHSATSNASPSINGHTAVSNESSSGAFNSGQDNTQTTLDYFNNVDAQKVSTKKESNAQGDDTNEYVEQYVNGEIIRVRKDTYGIFRVAETVEEAERYGDFVPAGIPSQHSIRAETSEPQDEINGSSEGENIDISKLFPNVQRGNGIVIVPGAVYEYRGDEPQQQTHAANESTVSKGKQIEKPAQASEVNNLIQQERKRLNKIKFAKVTQDTISDALHFFWEKRDEFINEHPDGVVKNDEVDVFSASKDAMKGKRTLKGAPFGQRSKEKVKAGIKKFLQKSVSNGLKEESKRTLKVVKSMEYGSKEHQKAFSVHLTQKDIEDEFENSINNKNKSDGQGVCIESSSESQDHNVSIGVQTANKLNASINTEVDLVLKTFQSLQVEYGEVKAKWDKGESLTDDEKSLLPLYEEWSKCANPQKFMNCYANKILPNYEIAKNHYKEAQEKAQEAGETLLVPLADQEFKCGNEVKKSVKHIIDDASREVK